MAVRLHVWIVAKVLVQVLVPLIVLQHVRESALRLVLQRVKEAVLTHVLTLALKNVPLLVLEHVLELVR